MAEPLGFRALVPAWRERAEVFRRHGATELCQTVIVLADELESALQAEAEHVLTIAEAAKESGLSPDHIGRLIREQKLPNFGRRGAPRVRRGDLPRRAGVAGDGAKGYDVTADARSLLQRRLHHGDTHGKQA